MARLEFLLKLRPGIAGSILSEEKPAIVLQIIIPIKDAQFLLKLLHPISPTTAVLVSLCRPITD